MTARVRTCLNCRHWHRSAMATVCPCGLCAVTRTVANRAQADASLAAAKHVDGGVLTGTECVLVTRPDFGCVQFAKRATPANVNQSEERSS